MLQPTVRRPVAAGQLHELDRVVVVVLVELLLDLTFRLAKDAMRVVQ